MKFIWVPVLILFLAACGSDVPSTEIDALLAEHSPQDFLGEWELISVNGDPASDQAFLVLVSEQEASNANFVGASQLGQVVEYAGARYLAPVEVSQAQAAFLAGSPEAFVFEVVGTSALVEICAQGLLHAKTSDLYLSFKPKD